MNASKDSVIGLQDTLDEYEPIDMSQYSHLLPKIDREDLLSKLKKCIARKVIFI